jgi:hypothetical protein
LNERNSPDAFFESIVAYVLPQLEGLAVETIVEFFNRVADDFVDRNQAQMKRYMTEMFEIEPGYWKSA